jgi:methyl-accepting chemotaxis protein
LQLFRPSAVILPAPTRIKGFSMDASVLDAGQATRSWSLRSKLFIAAFAGTVAVLALIIGIVAWLSRNSALRSAEQLVQQTSQASAHQVETRLAASWSTAEALTQLSMSLHQSKIGREATSAATRALLEVNPQFVGLGSYWEPNAFDGRDADYVNKPGTDATGRYIEYQTRPDGVIKTVALVDYQKENADNQYYYRPMHTGKAWATEPYDYEITKGKHVLMMSMALPLLEQGKFLGAVTVDTPLDGIRNELANVKPYGGYVALLSTDGLYASHPEQKRLGQPAKELPEAARAAIAAGLPYQFERDGWGFRLEPVHLGRAPNPWALLVAYPQAAVLADLNQLIGWMVAVGGLGWWCSASCCGRWWAGRSGRWPGWRTASTPGRASCTCAWSTRAATKPA